MYGGGMWIVKDDFAYEIAISSAKGALAVSSSPGYLADSAREASKAGH
jgi:hypothetical protein